MTLLELAQQVKVDSWVEFCLQACLEAASKGFDSRLEAAHAKSCWVPRVQDLGFAVTFRTIHYPAFYDDDYGYVRSKMEDCVEMSGWASPDQAHGPLAVYHAAYTAARERIQREVLEGPFKQVQALVLKAAVNGSNHVWFPYVKSGARVEHEILTEILKNEGLVAEPSENGIQISGW